MHTQTTLTKNSNTERAADRLTAVLFLIYLLALLWILLFKMGVHFSYMDSRRINLIPFREPIVFHADLNVREIVLNAVIFVPLGIYTGILFYRMALGKKLLFFFLSSLTIEALQFILAVGAFDVTDIITNTSGGCIGLLVFKAIEKAFNHKTKAQRVINLMAATGTGLMILFLVLLKLNMLPVRYQ